MQRLQAPTFAGPGSQGSPPASGTALRTLNLGDPLPKISSPLTDVEIPRAVWSAWHEEGKPRQIRRPLADSERRALEVRRDEIAPALVAFEPRDAEHVLLAVVDMFSSCRSMRQTGEEALAVAESTCRALDEFPAWAILKVCRSIQQNGVWRDGKFDRVWPPNDSEVVAAVRAEIAFYGRRHSETVALLAATVEER